MPILEGKDREEPEFFVSGLKKHRMIRKGDYKIVKVNNGPWELYNIIKDPTELMNLADRMPDTVEEKSDFYNGLFKE